MDTNYLNEYIREIENLSQEEHALHMEVGLVILENLRKTPNTSIKKEKQISSLINLIYCHRIGIRKTA